MTATSLASAAGVIATFYSYKGGTGRSMALANIGFLLGKSLAGNDRILLIDWDLEAPGLNRYFPICDFPENAERAGIIDYFIELQRQLQANAQLYSEISEAEGWRTLDSVVPLDKYVISNVAARVDFIRAGRAGEDYPDRIGSFDWAEFYRRYHLVYAAFRALLARRYNWTLIDSRTGLNDASGVCTMLLPEKLVAVFTPNRQSVEGLIDLIRKAIQYRSKSEDSRPLAILPLPSRIVTEEHKLLQEAQASYRSDFEKCLRQAYGLSLPENFLNKYFNEVGIPHKGFYGFKEQVAVRDDERATDALSINRAYERFFRRFILLQRAWEDLPAEAGVQDALTKRFKFDAFVSYAHLDNLPVAGESWIKQFVDALTIRLAQLLGKEASIFFDLRMSANEAFDDSVHTALINSAILIPILSPAYMNSNYAVREFEEFQQRASALTPGVTRICPVVLRPVSPTLVRDVMRFNAFDLNMPAGQAEPYSATSPQYWKFISEVANSLAATLKKLSEPSDRVEDRRASVSVYLAETTSDLSMIRDRLRTELVQSGYSVLPREALPTNASELGQIVRYDLSRTNISLHLLSYKYGVVPEGETRSISQIQCSLAAEFPLQRLIWTKEDTELVDQRQKEFMEDLFHNVDARTEIMRTSFEPYRELIFSRLAALSKPPKTIKQGFVVYIICLPEDRSAVAPIRDLLVSEKVEAFLPALEGSPDERYRDHQQNLESCNGVIVYWGAGAETWFRSHLREILKQRSSRELPAVIVLAQPLTQSKAEFRMVELPSVRFDVDSSKLVGVIRETFGGSQS